MKLACPDYRTLAVTWYIAHSAPLQLFSAAASKFRAQCNSEEGSCRRKLRDHTKPSGQRRRTYCRVSFAYTVCTYLLDLFETDSVDFSFCSRTIAVAREGYRSSICICGRKEHLEQSACGSMTATTGHADTSVQASGPVTYVHEHSCVTTIPHVRVHRGVCSLEA